MALYRLEKWKTDDGYKKPIKCLSALFRGVASNHNGDFLYFGCLHSNRTDKKLKDHERLCNKHDYCDIRMPSEGKKHYNMIQEKNH